MSELKDHLVRLGTQNPALREHIRPLLATLAIEKKGSDDWYDDPQHVWEELLDNQLALPKSKTVSRAIYRSEAHTAGLFEFIEFKHGDIFHRKPDLANALLKGLASRSQWKTQIDVGAVQKKLRLPKKTTSYRDLEERTGRTLSEWVTEYERFVQKFLGTWDHYHLAEMAIDVTDIDGMGLPPDQAAKARKWFEKQGSSRVYYKIYSNRKGDYLKAYEGKDVGMDAAIYADINNRYDKVFDTETEFEAYLRRNGYEYIGIDND